MYFIIYFNLIYSPFCLFEAIYPSRGNTDWYAMAYFLCGWLAFSVYMKQIFYLDQEEDEKEENIPMEELNNIREREDFHIFDQSGNIIGELESVCLNGSQRVARRKKLIQIMLYS